MELKEKKTTWLGAALCIGIIGSGCATKKYVGKEVGAVNQKVESLSESVERNQERIGRNEEEIARQGGEIQRVDAKADEAGQLAASAHDEAEKAFQEAERAMKGKLLYEVTLSNDKVSFAFNTSELSPDAQMLVDELAEKVKADNRGLWIEIEGHTDATGDPSYNKALGLKRAEAVRDYLYQAHGLPLHRISVYSFGEEQPVSDNANREGRSRNRRVVIKVLE
ncbi:MAG TPA: OmpA family protein [Vicinamibacteria bacterium]|nr:OmpA family protein [Vicinamibacteria bacterium]